MGRPVRQDKRRSSRRIRTNPSLWQKAKQMPDAEASLLAALPMDHVSRQEAIEQVKRLLQDSQYNGLLAQRFIDLFHLDAEELLEAGLSYEALKSLSNRNFW